MENNFFNRNYMIYVIKSKFFNFKFKNKYIESEQLSVSQIFFTYKLFI